MALVIEVSETNGRNDRQKIESWTNRQSREQHYTGALQVYIYIGTYDGWMYLQWNVNGNTVEIFSIRKYL